MHNPNTPIRIGIVGGAGYTAGELIRLLLIHPMAELVWVHSKSQSGQLVACTHRDLLGDTALRFCETFDFEAIDLLFLCVGHGEAEVFMAQNTPPAALRVIDLSQDFRLHSPDNRFVYGLVELNRPALREAQYIANPGCFATAIQLALLPLAQAGALHDEVHIHAITGSTGAGQKLSPSSHFSWRNSNVSVYKAFEHQHLAEIGQSLRQLQPGFQKALNFIPMRGNFTRGIMATLYTHWEADRPEAEALFKAFYADSPQVHLVAQNPDLKQVVNTNKTLLHLEVHQGKLLIISMIDNLLKGASGQAVQNMNLMFGLPEDTGLRLKAAYF